MEVGTGGSEYGRRVLSWGSDVYIHMYFRVSAVSENALRTIKFSRLRSVGRSVEGGPRSSENKTK